MPIFLETSEQKNLYLGDTQIQKVYLGDTLVYSLLKLSRPPEGTYQNCSKVVFMPSNDALYPYKIRGGPTPLRSSTTVTLGDWKPVGYTYSAGETVEVYVEHIDGDMEGENSDPINQWIQIYPANVLRSWSAEDSTSIKYAWFKFTLRDNEGKTLEFWAQCSNVNDTTIITHTAPTIPGGGGPVEENPSNPGEFFPEDPLCLLSDMTVTMADGSSKLIQDVQVGDVLMSYDIDGLPLASDNPSILNTWSSLSLTGSPSITTVMSIKPFVINSYVVINDNIKTSPEHRHLVKTGSTWSFKRAIDVVVGDVFMTEAGVEQTITDVHVVNNSETVYKMDVENLDVFYANGVLTHNAKQLN